MEEPFPFFLELLGTSVGGCAPGDENDPVGLCDAIPGAMEDAAEASPHPVPYNRSSETFRGDQSEAEWFGQIFISEVSEHQKSSLNGFPLRTDTLIIGPVCDPPATRQFHFPVAGRRGPEESMRFSGGVPITCRAAPCGACNESPPLWG